MATLLTLPPELLAHILSSLDPKSLAKIGRVNRALHQASSDALLWKQIAYKDQHQHANVDHLQGKDIILKADWQHLKEEYQTFHPLYNTMQELSSIVEGPDKTDENKATALYEKASEGEPEDKIRYVKAIISCDEWHRLILQERSYSWIDLLLKEILPENSEITPQLLTSTSLQEYLLSETLGDFYLENILKTSDKTIIDFFTNPTLEKWKKELFANTSHCIMLKELLYETISKSPEMIPALLKDKAFQHWILSSKNADYILYKCIMASTEGPILLMDIPEATPLKEMFLSALDTGKKTVFNDLINEHPKFFDLLSKYPDLFSEYPKMLSLFPYNKLKRRLEHYPETFALKECYLLIASSPTNLSAQLNLLESIGSLTKNESFADWWRDAYSNKKIKGAVIYKLVHEMYLNTKEALPPKISVQQEFNLARTGEATTIQIQPVFIEPEQFHVEYLLLRDCRSAIMQGKITISELLKFTPSQFLKSISGYNIGEPAMIVFYSLGFISQEELLQALENIEGYRPKINNLYATYMNLKKDEKAFLEQQEINSFEDFITNIFTPNEDSTTQKSVLQQLKECTPTSLLSLTIRSLIRTKHISFNSAFHLEPSAVASAKEIDLKLTQNYPSTAHPVNRNHPTS